jgi:O-antigen ligase
MLVAFAGAYQWTTVPFCAGVALLCTIERPEIGRGPARLLDSLLIACLAIMALQLIPLSPAVRGWISPAAAPFERAVSLDPDRTVLDQTRRPVSLDAVSTAWALALGTSYVALFWCARSVFNRGSVRLTARTVAWVGLGLTSLVAAQQATAPKLLYWIWRPVEKNATPYGPFLNRNGLACWFAMAIPLVFGYLVARSRSQENASRGFGDIDLLQLWLAGSALLMTGGLLASLSRAAIVGSVAGLALFVCLARMRVARTSRLAILVAALAGMSAVATLYVNVGVLATRMGEAFDAGVGGRQRIWRDTWHMTRDFWLAGVGAGAYEHGMLVYQEGSRFFFFNHAHDEYLQILVEGGVLLAAPAALVLILAARLIAGQLRTERSALFWIRAGAASAILAVAVQSVWDTQLRTPANAALFAVVAAIALHGQRSVRHGEHRSRTKAATALPDSRMQGRRGRN